MATNRTEEFTRDAVRMALTSGLPRKKLASDLGVGLSTLNKWIKTYGGAETVPGNEAELIKEIGRFRRELRIVTEGEAGQERRPWRVSPSNEVLKKATAFFAGQ